MDFNEFRGHDVKQRKEKIRKALMLIPPETGEDIPVLAHTSPYFAFGNALKPEGYWTDPAVMLRFQQDGFETHLKLVCDDVVPYFMPWFGTGVLATAFGCPCRESRGAGDEPTVCGSAISDVKDVTKLKLHDLEKGGFMPRVTRFMEYAAKHGEIPVGLSDLNSPLSTALQICGYENFLCWMVEEVAAVEDVMSIVTEAFISWVHFQKQITGEGKGWSNGLQGIYTPVGGVWVSDDDLVNIGPEHYKRFIMPHYDRIYKEFGGGHLHWCGRGAHQHQNILAMKHVTTVNNSPMGKMDAFDDLYKTFSGKKAIEVQDLAPEDPDSYYDMLFRSCLDMRGILVTTFVTDHLAMNLSGETVPVSSSPIDRANAVARAVRAAGQRVISRGKLSH